MANGHGPLNVKLWTVERWLLVIATICSAITLAFTLGVEWQKIKETEEISRHNTTLISGHIANAKAEQEKLDGRYVMRVELPNMENQLKTLNEEVREMRIILNRIRRESKDDPETLR